MHLKPWFELLRVKLCRNDLKGNKNYFEVGRFELLGVQVTEGKITVILGDPGADSGDEEKSKRVEKYMARRKVKNGEKSPWGQCLTRPVPNSCCHSGF